MLEKKRVGESFELAEESQNDNLYRVGHPLAQNVIESCKSTELELSELTFDYTGNIKKISVLEELVGKQGWLQVKQFSISSFETEDYLLLSGITDSGIALNQQQVQRIFSLPASKRPLSEKPTQNIFDYFIQGLDSQKQILLEENRLRNHTYFDEEVDKLEKWSEDVRNSIKMEIKDLDKEIKSRKTEARKLLNLEEKVKEQRNIKELEKKLAEKRYTQYQSEDEIEIRKDKLLDAVEKRLSQQLTEVELFTIQFKVI
ncbi:MAG: hypothetical protein IPI10_17450 [Bacteroidetes bacterium]|nr:hypothetical protein [Bacteroidota bacterium]